MGYLRIAILWLILSLMVAIYGCTNTNNKTAHSSKPTNTVNHPANIEHIASQLYLRGSFNLWDYQSEYKLFKVAANTFAAAAQLTKGQRYEFLFSAKDASKPNSNCGYTKHAQIALNVKVKASCNNIVLQSFVFIPPKSATYEFFIEMTSINNPLVYVKKAY